MLVTEVLLVDDEAKFKVVGLAGSKLEWLPPVVPCEAVVCGGVVVPADQISNFN
jgi:hypothetical protein